MKTVELNFLSDADLKINMSMEIYLKLIQFLRNCGGLSLANNQMPTHLLIHFPSSVGHRMKVE